MFELYIALVIASAIGIALGILVGYCIPKDLTKALLGGSAFVAAIVTTAPFFVFSVVAFSPLGIILSVSTALFIGIFIGVGGTIKKNGTSPH